VLLAVHLAGYLTAVFTVLSLWQALAFIAVHQAVFGIYLGTVFAVNHKGMPLYNDQSQKEFFYRQVLTSRNLYSGRVIEFLFGGVNYQIEHHLFPSMPRPNLRRARPLIKEFCRQKGVPYTECGLLASYREVFVYLHRIGRVRSDALARPEAAT
jgi:fatty acid desaturase